MDTQTIGTVTVQLERAHELWEEAMPLFERHRQEIASYPDILLNVDVPTYCQLEEAGILRCYTARVNGELIGYAVFFCKRNLHYQDSLQAVQDVLFVLPEHRNSRTGYRLIRFAELSLQAEGCQVVYHHSKIAHDIGPLLERMGYEKTEYIYAKRLDHP